MSSLLLEKALINASHRGKFCSKATTQCRALEGWGPSPALGGGLPQVALCPPFVGDSKFCHSVCMAFQATKLLVEAESGELPGVPHGSPVKPPWHATQGALIQSCWAWVTFT